MTERGKKSEYIAVLPLDMLLLKELPKEGTMFANIYPLGASIETLRNKKQFSMLSSEIVTARIRTMHHHKLVEKVTTVGAGGKWAWQITAKGQTQLREWEKGTTPSEPTGEGRGVTREVEDHRSGPVEDQG